MIPVSDSDAPSVDRGVLKRLRRLDPQLRVTFHRYAIDPLSGQPVRGPSGAPILDPSFHLWRKEEGSSRHWYVRASGPYFGHREVWKLERDAGRFMEPADILRRHRERSARRQAREHAAYAERHQDMAKVNSRRINDLVFHGKTGRRTRKPISFPGQTSRDTSGSEAFLTDPREDGWELPDPE